MKDSDSNVGTKIIIKLYYTALMTFLVFTVANDLLKGIFVDNHIEYALYLIFWFALVIQTTFAYRHIMAIEENNYTVKVLISDCIDVIIEIFVCSVIGSTYRANSYCELEDYRLLSIPFMVLAINQLYWFASVKEDNHRAVGRLIVLFVGMLAVTISESIYHTIWNLAAFVLVHALAMAILRASDEIKYQREKDKKSKEEGDNVKTTIPNQPK